MPYLDSLSPLLCKFCLKPLVRDYEQLALAVRATGLKAPHPLPSRKRRTFFKPGRARAPPSNWCLISVPMAPITGTGGPPSNSIVSSSGSSIVVKERRANAFQQEYCESKSTCSVRVSPFPDRFDTTAR